MARRRAPAPEVVADALAPIVKSSRDARRHEAARAKAIEQRDAAIAEALRLPINERPTHAQIAEVAGIDKNGIPAILRQRERRGEEVG